MSNSLSYIDIKKMIKTKKEDYKKYKFAILADSATQHLRTAIDGIGASFKYNLEIFEADYNQIDIQLNDPHSDYYQFDAKMTLLFFCNEILFEKYCNTPLENRSVFYQRITKQIIAYWNTIQEKTKSAIIHPLFIESNDMIYGNYGLNVVSSFISQIRKINNELIDYSRSAKGIYLLNLTDCAMELGRKKLSDPKIYQLTKMSIDLNSIPFVATTIVKILIASDGKIKKCVVCDLDNTLWGGVIGDDGIDGIQIGEYDSGPAFTEFQRYLKELKNRGILIAICSKNNIDTAKEPFISHPDMILRLDDISIFVANWNDKSTNLQYIQKTLNIGMDSLVFIDDNPFERELIKKTLPEITVPDMPEDPSEYTEYLCSLNLFETVSYSSEDVNRTKQYREEAKRVEFLENHKDYDSYLANLNMIATVSKFDSFHIPRIAQLTQRSNQFNLRTVRLSEEDVKEISSDPQYIPFYLLLKDSFGDYGLVSVVILRALNTDTLFIDEWLMSCRVLKRGVEEFIINKIVEIAKERHYSTIIGEYLPTPKNRMVSNIYAELGFKKENENRFVLDVAKFQHNKTFVKEL